MILLYGTRRRRYRAGHSCSVKHRTAPPPILVPLPPVFMFISIVCCVPAWVICTAYALLAVARRFACCASPTFDSLTGNQAQD